MAKNQPQKKNDTSFKEGNKKGVGRPKGSVNKINAKQKATLEMVMDSLAETILEDLSLVTPSRRLEIFKELQPYIRPRLASNKNENSHEVKGEVKVNIKFGDLLGGEGNG
ncbi:hypothetical protein [Sphingobacterium sp.]|uniref:hypothetical protein n=1 Tax=Sphingobacterium sp. TaxID=341027 RepID=UPI0028A6467A|nr:hypothetical protein [Sphingobacterium sp.]